MGFEGYTQFICANRHYYEVDAYWESTGEKCYLCGESPIWWNLVDSTNGEDEGRVDVEIDVEANISQCEKCGEVKVIEHEKYRVPNEK